MRFKKLFFYKEINQIKAYFAKNFTKRDIRIGTILLLFILFIAFLGKQQIDTRRIRQGKTEFRQGNWRLSYRILFDYRHHFAFDKEACWMLGCLMKRGFGDAHDNGEGSSFWLNKANEKDCQNIH